MVPAILLIPKMLADLVGMGQPALSAALEAGPGTNGSQPGALQTVTAFRSFNLFPEAVWTIKDRLNMYIVYQAIQLFGIQIVNHFEPFYGWDIMESTLSVWPPARLQLPIRPYLNRGSSSP